MTYSCPVAVAAATPGADAADVAPGMAGQVSDTGIIMAYANDIDKLLGRTTRTSTSQR